MLSRLAYSLIALFMLATVAFQDNALATGKNTLCVIPYRTYCENVGGKFFHRVEILLHKDLVEASCTSSSEAFGTHTACNLKEHMFNTWERDQEVWGHKCDAKPCVVTICGKKHTVVFYRVKGDRIADFCKFKKDFEDDDMEEGDFDWFNVANTLFKGNNPAKVCDQGTYKENATKSDSDDGRAEAYGTDPETYFYLPLIDGNNPNGPLDGDDVILSVSCVQQALCNLAKKHELNSPCCEPAFFKGCDDKTRKSILIDLLQKLADPKLHPKSFKFKGNLNLCEKECIELSGTVCPVDSIDLVCNKYEVTLDKGFVDCWIRGMTAQLGILSATEPRAGSNDRDVVSGSVGDVYTQIKRAVSEGNLMIHCVSSEEVKDDKGNVIGLKSCYEVSTGVTKDDGDFVPGSFEPQNAGELLFYPFYSNKAVTCKFCLTLKY